jgi:hypothetical protein
MTVSITKDNDYGAIIGLWVMTARGWKWTADERWYLSLLTAWLVFPIAMVFLVSQMTPIFVNRYLVMCVPAVVLLASVSLRRLSRESHWWAKPLAVLFGVLFLSGTIKALDNYYQIRAQNHNEWKPAVEYVLSGQQPGDGIFFYPYRHPFYYYLRQEMRKTKCQFYPTRLFSTFPDELPILYQSPSEELVTSVLRGYDRIWLVAPPEDKQHDLLMTTIDRQNLTMIRTIFNEHFQVVSEAEFPGFPGVVLAVQLYVRHISHHGDK